jgi:hypothetical protein
MVITVATENLIASTVANEGVASAITLDCVAAASPVNLVTSVGAENKAIASDPSHHVVSRERNEEITRLRCRRPSW